MIAFRGMVASERERMTFVDEQDVSKSQEVCGRDTGGARAADHCIVFVCTQNQLDLTQSDRAGFLFEHIPTGFDGLTTCHKDGWLEGLMGGYNSCNNSGGIFRPLEL